jgi:hypothetical protein
MSGTDPASSSRRIIARAALLLLPLVGMGIATPYLLRSRAAGAEAPPPSDRPATDEEEKAARVAEERLADARKGWQGSSTIAPKDGVPDAKGERVRWFQGFGLSVESWPAGARVKVNGVDEGVTPLLTSVACAPGERVTVEVRKASLRSKRRTTVCRKDELVLLEFELE